jgi:hypothetical protein
VEHTTRKRKRKNPNKRKKNEILAFPVHTNFEE